MDAAKRGGRAERAGGTGDGRRGVRARRAAAWLAAVACLAAPAAVGPRAALAQDRSAERPGEPLAVQRIYVSPAGTGNESGSRPESAMPFAQALTLIRAAGRPLHVRLLAGEYRVPRGLGFQLQTRRPGGFPVTIEGSGPQTVFRGDYELGREPGEALVTLARGNVTLANFAVRNVTMFLNVPTGAEVRNVTLRDLQIEEVHSGVLVDVGKNLRVSDWTIENVRIARYFRVGIRLAGAFTENIAVRRATVDGAGTNGVDHCFKVGIQLLEGVRNVLIEDTSVRNNVACPAAYQQGDGIESDDRRGAPDGITLRRVTVAGNRDGNVDLKSVNTVLEDVVAQQDGVSRYNYRFWNHNYRCVNCRSERAAPTPAEGGGPRPGPDIWLGGAQVDLIDSPLPPGGWGVNCANANAAGEARPGAVRPSVDGRAEPSLTCPPAP